MKMNSTRKRLSATEVNKQLKKISQLRGEGHSVAQACKKAGVPVPTYYFRLKHANGAVGQLRRKPSGLQVLKPVIDGRTLAALRRSKAKHATLAATIEKDLVELRKLGRRMLRVARSLG